MEEESYAVYKVALLGPHNAGKTSIVNSYHTGQFTENVQPTIGANFKTKIVEKDGNKIELQLWDTSGEEKYRSVSPIYYRDAACCIAVYDGSDEDSLNLLHDFVNDFLDCRTIDGDIWVVCNKIDLMEDDSLAKRGEAYAQEQGFKFAKTSAKQNVGIVEMFNQISENMITTHAVQMANLKKNTKKGCC